MPLPNIKKFCTAKSKRTGLPCNNPAAFGCKTCKVHGAHHINRGQSTSRYKHGMYSESGIAEYRAGMARLQNLEQIGFDSGLMSGYRTKGRKVNASN